MDSTAVPQTKPLQQFACLIACTNGEWSVQAAAPEWTGGSMLKQVPGCASFDVAMTYVRDFYADALRQANRGNHS